VHASHANNKENPVTVPNFPMGAFVATILLVASSLNAQVKQNTNDVQDIVLLAVPDLMQTSKQARFPGGGSQFCAPVCVSNSLVWLEQNPDPQYQMAVALKLSGANYMNTDLGNGTGTTEVIHGVGRYAREVWGSCKRLEYCGWRMAPAENTVGKKPTIKWMTDGLHGRASVWVNVGWYNYSADQKTFLRVGGHWVTLVGYQHGRLVFHDPAPRAGDQAQQEHVEFMVLQSGTLAGNKKGLPLDATGSILLGDGMHMSARAKHAIIDGVVIFELPVVNVQRYWVSNDSQHSFKAKFVSLVDGRAELLSAESNETMLVELEKFCQSDQRLLTELAAAETTGSSSGQKPKDDK